MAHKDEVQDYMIRMNLAIVALSETRLISEIEDSEVNAPGYSLDAMGKINTQEA